MPSLEETYREIHGGVAARPTEVDVVRVSGPDTMSYLQGQLSQDLDGLEIGASRESLLLSPQGKLVAYVRVLRAGEEEALVIVDAGYGEAVLERLLRFKLRVKASFSTERLPLLELRGPKAAATAATLPGALAHLVVDWPGESGVDVLGSGVLPDGLAEGDAGAFEAVRIEAGRPQMGAELTEATIPPEAGIVGRTVSFTKGCYTGQELVARLDARGNRVPRNLRAVVLGGDSSPEVGDHLVLGEREVGTLTSVARSPRLGPVALAYVRREVDPPVEVAVDGGRGVAEVRALPLARD